MWTLLEGTLFAEDLRGQSQQEELRGDGGAKGEALGFSLSRESESCFGFVIIAVFV